MITELQFENRILKEKCDALVKKLDDLDACD